MFTKLATPALLLALASSVAVADDAHPRVLINTSEGDIVLELDRTKAPVTVDNFLAYVDDGFYNGTIFHRVIKGFMAQGGGFTADFEQKSTKKPIKNEADNGLKNDRGTIAMARTSDPQSATAQFFLNTVNNGFLNFNSPTPNGWGYAVFGRVVEGMDVLDRIEAIPTGHGGPFPRDVPRTMVTIEKMTRVASKAAN
ncbi:MAG: peptidyl-prolyl cis-trans isomerase [Chromatiales bacterium]|jgi:cyclophilin family peptidyl-prolyl cis-trans isomerase|nr:peptidyl-prolyl cis-trans isomerase [Chromatiales bacterium]